MYQGGRNIKASTHARDAEKKNRPQSLIHTWQFKTAQRFQHAMRCVLEASTMRKTRYCLKKNPQKRLEVVSNKRYGEDSMQ